MTRISKYRVEDKVLKKLYFLMFEIISNMDEEERFTAIISELLSPTEKIMIVKRVAIIYLLMKEIDYLVISDVLKVSSRTIAKFHSIMDEGKEVMSILEAVVGNEKIKDFFEELLFREPGTYGVNWKSAWRQKFEIERKKQRGI
ncbi:MAG: Trp family transcriptional regulator [Patescibacteria group bacterium]|jgi:Trp operon repressor